MTSSRRVVRTAAVAGFLAWLAACRVGPSYHAPALPAHSAVAPVSLTASAETTDPPPDGWWRLYEDERLDALIVEALRANRSLTAADADFAAARAALSAVHASRYPTTQASAGGIYGRDAATDEILELQGRPPQTFWLFSDIFQAAYEIDLFGRVHRAIEAANANADSLAAARDGVRVVVAAETTRAYSTLCGLGEQLDVARHSLDVVSREAKITRQRHEAGANSVLDVTRADALVSQVRSAIPTLEGQRRVVLFELTALLGRTPSDAPHEVESCVTPPRLTASLPVGDGAALLRRRPDVRQAERRLASATAQIGVATAELYPTIHLVGLYGGAAVELSQLNTNIGRTWGIGPSISWSFPNMAGPRARVRQAEATQVAALASFDGVVLTALKEVEQTLSTYAAALENRQSLALARDQVRSAFGIAHEELLAGSVSNLDVLITEQSLVSLEAAVAAADTALSQDQIAVFKALGGGWHEGSQFTR